MARHKAVVVLLGLVTLMLAAVGGWAVYLNNQIGTIPKLDLDLNLDIPQSERPPEPKGPAADAVNILLAGVDAGESSRIQDELAKKTWTPGSHRSDTIMILHLTADRKQAYLVSIPRDTWVSIDGWGKAKINAAFSYGGPSLYVSTIERFTGLRMDHLVIADWDGFKFLTDELGGVRVSTGSGTQLLDGEQALEYVRERETLPRGDLDRIQRQQNVLRELSQQVMSGGTLANPAKLTGIINVVADSLAVDKGFTAGEMRSLALSMRDIRSGDVTHVTIPVARFDRIDGQSVVIADRPGTRALFSAVLTDELDDYLATHDADTLPEPKNVS